MREATDIVNRFDAFGPGKFFAGDFTGFDSTQMPQIMASILRKWRSWHYGAPPEDDVVREMLCDETVQSTHVTGFNKDGESETTLDIIYKWFMSLPSGHPATTQCNNFYNLTVFAYIFHDVYPERRFSEDMCMLVYGDDNIGKVSQAFITHAEATQRPFTQETLTTAFKEILDMDYTDEDKTGLTVGLRGIEDVSFLKRKFVDLDGSHDWAMVLALESINKSLYWTKDVETHSEAIKSALLELSVHPYDVWVKYVNLLLHAEGYLDETYVSKLRELQFDRSIESQRRWREMYRNWDYTLY
jgi:hypothetical protein